MKLRQALIPCALGFLCVAGTLSTARAQSKDRAFDPGMSLEETVAWLGKQLTHSRTVVADDGRYIRYIETRLVRAKGCSLSYWSTSEYDSTRTDPVSYSNRVRELWTIDLAGLEPLMVRGGATEQVRFTASGTPRNAIRTNVFRNETILTSHVNRRQGYFWVGEKASAAEVAAGLRHAVELCQPKKP